LSSDSCLERLIKTGVLVSKYARHGIATGGAERVASLCPPNGKVAKIVNADIAAAKAAGRTATITVDGTWAFVVDRRQVRHTGLWQTKAKNIAKLPDITKILFGKSTEAFGRKAAASAVGECCFSVCTQVRSILFALAASTV
jgi:hypothetical protein